MFIVLIIVAIAVALSFEFFYLRNLIGRTLRLWGLNTEKKKIKIVKYLIVAMFMGATVPIFTIVGMLTLHIVIVAAFIDLTCFIVHFITKKRWRALNFIASSLILPVLIGVAAVIYGYINIHNVVKTEYQIETDKDLSQEYRVAFISDVHMGISLDLDEMREVAKEIAEQKPHLLLLGGDIVDESTTIEEMKEVFKIFGGIETTYGTYFVYGNHDDLGFTMSRSDYTDKDLREAINEAGITLLEDEITEIGNDIVLIGRRDASFKGNDETKERQSISQLTKSVDKNKFILLLDHQPREYEKNKEAGVDLALSGHTHAGQIWPLGIFTTLIAPNEQSYGHTQYEDFQAIVSSGIAGWGFPIKTSKSAEYLLVTISEK